MAHGETKAATNSRKSMAVERRIATEKWEHSKHKTILVPIPCPCSYLPFAHYAHGYNPEWEEE